MITGVEASRLWAAYRGVCMRWGGAWHFMSPLRRARAVNSITRARIHPSGAT